MTALTDSPAWHALVKHAAATGTATLSELFAADPERVERLTHSACGITLDASKTHLIPGVEADLRELAQQEDVAGWRERMFAGERVNHTEGRAALHAALRTPELGEARVDNKPVGPEVAATRRQMAELVDGVRDGSIAAADGGPFTDVVNIGIGGSDLGPRLIHDALADGGERLRAHFIANIDPADRQRVLARIDPRRTLFIVASKTFTTLETLANARACRECLTATAGEAAVTSHFVAVTGAPGRAREFGIADGRILSLPDWVGGRYSVWSAIGLPIALSFGNAIFDELLAGAAAMDRHFRTAPDDASLPMQLALIGIWYGNFLGARSRVIVPYAERLAYLPAYLQQLELESNGKSVDREGRAPDHATAPAIWGAVGTTAQHAFFQWLHQGTDVVPVQFIAVRDGTDPDGDALAANCFGQSAALLEGVSRESLRQQRVDASLQPHRAMSGNRPSTTLLLEDLGAATLGALLAMYEHKVFCQAMIWRINPFDQWGVERGKALARALQPVIAGEPADGWDASTRSLAARYRGST